MRKWVLAVVVLVVLAGFYQFWYRPRANEPEPGSYAWQVKQFRKDSEQCSKFAIKREEARKLLAFPQKDDPSVTIRNLDADLEALTARWKVDERICLREIGWPQEQIDRFTPVIEKERADEFCNYHRNSSDNWRRYKMPNCDSG